MFALRIHPSVVRIHPTMATRALSRLNLFKDHLQFQTHTLNTPFSTERSSLSIHEKEVSPEYSRFYSTERAPKAVEETPTKMSNQEPHAALLIPGPIEFDDAVLQAMSHYRYVLPCLWIDALPNDREQRVARRPALRKCLRRDADDATETLPNRGPSISALPSFRLRHPRLGPSSSQPCRARRRSPRPPHGLLCGLVCRLL